MKSPEEKYTREQITTTRDLALHANERCHVIVRDACSLIEERELAYSIVLHVIASLACSAARLGEKKTHRQNIKGVLLHMVDLMRDHESHGE